MAPSRFTSSSILAISLLASTTTAHPSLHTRDSSPSDCFPPANSTSPTLSWSSCPSALNAPSTLQCANFTVPVNWSDPYGSSFPLGIVKLPSTNSSSKIGSLFLNFGGPGVATSGIVSRLAAAGAVLPALGSLFDAFDIIGIDPRGIGLSGQVQCNASIYLESVSLFPQSQSDYDKLVDRNKRFGESCMAGTGELLGFIDTTR